MAISIADISGPFLDPILPMPDLKKSAPFKQSFLHRLGLRKWLARDSHRNQPASKPSSPVPPLPPVPLPLAAPPPPIESTLPIERRSYDESAARYNPKRLRGDRDRLGRFRECSPETKESENREPLTPNEKPDRRAISADHQRSRSFHRTRSPHDLSVPRSSVPELQWDETYFSAARESLENGCDPGIENCDTANYSEAQSVNGEDYERELQAELDKKWILNLCMRFRDTDREKFFITFAESPNRWRRVTVTCDYRDAEPDSLEQNLKELRLHRDKNTRIYESIRESIDEIEFYETVTNLRLQTREGRLHVHVTEDVNEIVPYPPISSIAHLSPPLIPESHVEFHNHMSGFVYHVKLNGTDYVKKEITGPDTVEEFLYEINALHALLESDCVIKFKGVLVDDSMTIVKGLLLEYASQGSLADMFFDFKGNITWSRRERWARQIIKGLADIHEAGFVQGDFTVSNIVVDENDDAKIIDINRRGCPIGWEPPEFIKKIESKQRISMYIGVKSDIFQLGMTLWAMVMEEDEPGTHDRPLTIPYDMEIPQYFRNIVRICLSARPQNRFSAKELLILFPNDLSNPVTDNHLDEYPEQDSGNFTTTQKYHTKHPDFHHSNHTHDCEPQRVSTLYANSFANSNRCLDHEEVKGGPGMHLHPESLSKAHAFSHQADTHVARSQDEAHPYASSSLPPDDLYRLEEVSLSVEPTDTHPVLEDMTQYGFEPNGLQNVQNSQRCFKSGSLLAKSDSPLDPLESRNPNGIKRLPEVLTGVGDHISFSYTNSSFLSEGRTKAQQMPSETDLLAGTERSSVHEDAAAFTADETRVDSGSDCDATVHNSYSQSVDNLALSELPINPAFVASSTEKITICPLNKPYYSRHSPKYLHADNDALFTSNLPLNPAFLPSL